MWSSSSLLSIYLINEILKTTSLNYKLILATGISLGLLVLSRQWGFFIFPAIFLLVIWIFIQDRQTGWLRTRQFFLITLLSAIIGGWFYIHLYLDYGTFSAFNIKQPKYPSTEETLSFFRQTELQNLKLFQEPVRPVFDHQSFFAIMYSETWGDYWGYFTFIKPGSAPDNIGNQAAIAPYLGQVNLASVLPSLLLLAGLIFGIIQIFQLGKSPNFGENCPGIYHVAGAIHYFRLSVVHLPILCAKQPGHQSHLYHTVFYRPAISIFRFHGSGQKEKPMGL